MKPKQSFALLVREVSKVAVKGFNLVTSSILGVGLFIIFCLVSGEAVLRYTMHSMPLGMEELAVIVAAWVYFTGVALSSRDEKQITVNIFHVVHIPRRAFHYLNVFADFVVIFLSGYFAYIALLYTLQVHANRITIEPFHVTKVVQVVALAVGLSLACVYTIVSVIKKLRIHEPASESEGRH